MSEVWKTVLKPGLFAYAEIVNDQNLALLAGQAAALLSSHWNNSISEADSCRFAFPSFVITPAIRTQCFVVVLSDRLLVAWQRGIFRKATESKCVELTEIQSVSWGKGSSAGVRGAILFDVKAKGDSFSLALPLNSADRVGQALKSALGL